MSEHLRYAVAGPRPEPPRLQPIRGRDGRLYGYYDPETHTLEVKRGQAVERIPLPPPIAQSFDKS